MKKKIAAIVLVLSLLFSLTACVASDKKKLAEMSKAKESSTAAGEEALTAAGETKAANNSGEKPTLEMTPEESQIFDALNIDPNKLLEESSTEPLTLVISQDLIADNGKEINVDLNSDGTPASSGTKQDFKNIIKSRKFTLEGVFMADGETRPVKIAVDGNKYFLETSGSPEDGFTAKVQMIIDGKNIYTVVPALKMYMKIDETEDSDYLDPEEFVSIDSEYISSSEVVVDGKTYLCEHYKSEGTETKYYFLEGKIKRVEIINDDGATTIIDLTKFTDSVDENLFKLPSGYMPLDLEKLANATATTRKPE